MCSLGLANPGEAFTVFYGERNPWCEYITHPVIDFHHLIRIQGVWRRMKLVLDWAEWLLISRDYHPLSRQSRSWLQVCGEYSSWEAGRCHRGTGFSTWCVIGRVMCVTWNSISSHLTSTHSSIEAWAPVMFWPVLMNRRAQTTSLCDVPQLEQFLFFSLTKVFVFFLSAPNYKLLPGLQRERETKVRTFILFLTLLSAEALWLLFTQYIKIYSHRLHCDNSRMDLFAKNVFSCKGFIFSKKKWFFLKLDLNKCEASPRSVAVHHKLYDFVEWM